MPSNSLLLTGWFGAFGEIGNFYVADNAEPADRCFSWCKTNNCLFVDQPVATGFSFQTVTATGAIISAIDDIDYTNSAKEAMQQVAQAASALLSDSVTGCCRYSTCFSNSAICSQSSRVLL